MTTVFVSSNSAKCAFWKDMAAAEHFPLTVTSTFADVPEIQGSVQRIAEQKVRDMHQLHPGVGVIAEDVSLSVEDFGGPPGPYIKYWDNPYLPDGSCAVFTVAAAFFDGSTMYTEFSHCSGRIRQGVCDTGAGFDPVFWPDGAGSVLGAMSLADQQKWSPRAAVARALFQRVQESK